jgi:hypothetical protein
MLLVPSQTHAINCGAGCKVCEVDCAAVTLDPSYDYCYEGSFYCNGANHNMMVDGSQNGPIVCYVDDFDVFGENIGQGGCVRYKDICFLNALSAPTMNKCNTSTEIVTSGDCPSGYKEISNCSSNISGYKSDAKGTYYYNCS